MRFFEETAVWAALKRLAMGLGLIALFSAISDLGHRKTASAASSSAHGQAGAAGGIHPEFSQTLRP